MWSIRAPAWAVFSELGAGAARMSLRIRSSTRAPRLPAGAGARCRYVGAGSVGTETRHDQRCAHLATLGLVDGTGDVPAVPAHLVHVDDRPPPHSVVNDDDHRGESWGPARRPSLERPIVHLIPASCPPGPGHHARWDPPYCCDARSDKPGEVRLGPIAANSHPVRRHPGATDPTARWEADTLMRPPRVATNICSHRDTT